MKRNSLNTTIVATVIGAILLSLLGLGFISEARAQEIKDTKYVGMTKCAACHFQQYAHWKTSPHGKAFEILPTKYKEDASCLKCHTTGYGLPTNLEDPKEVYAMGVNCEACHGPGSEHAKTALAFVEQPMTEAGLDRLRKSIQKNDPQNVCITCHLSMAHGSHPEFDREPGTAALPSPRARRSQGFFQVHSD
jgi:hypothetical protein